IATLFHEAKSLDEAKNAVKAARRSISGKPSGKRTKRSPTEAETHASSVLGHSALTGLIRRFQITTATLDPLADLRPTVAARWIPPEGGDRGFHHAQGGYR